MTSLDRAVRTALRADRRGAAPLRRTGPPAAGIAGPVNRLSPLPARPARTARSWPGSASWRSRWGGPRVPRGRTIQPSSGGSGAPTTRIEARTPLPRSPHHGPRHIERSVATVDHHDGPLHPTARRRSAPALAVDLFNYTWTLIEKPDRTAEDDAMIHAAHASRHHWSRRRAGRRTPHAASGSARACTRSWGARSRRCGTPAAASRSARRTDRGLGHRVRVRGAGPGRSARSLDDLSPDSDRSGSRGGVAG